MESNWKLVLLLWLGSINAEFSDDWSKLQCTSQNTCRECIQQPSCAWCTKPDFSGNSRCFHLISEDSNYCPPEYSYNPDNMLMILQYKSLSRPRVSPIPAESYTHRPTSSSNTSLEEIVQFAPQRVNLKIRARERYTMHAQYIQVEEFPLDIYLLMDFSKSMEGNSEKLTRLADSLAKVVPNITTNLRLGFGSFADRTFQHAMSLSTQTNQFSSLVKKAVTNNFNASGSLKTGVLPVNSTAGLQAIMQAIVCKQYISWRENARRVLIFASNLELQSDEIKFANYDLCNWGGGSVNVARINEKVKQNSINLLFAVTADQMSNYKKVQDKIEGSYTVMLTPDSSNIVEMVKEEYNKMSAVIQLKDNSSDGITINYYSNCLDPSGEFKKTDRCENVKVGDIVSFKIEVEVTRCPRDPEDWKQRLQIYPIGVNETMYMDLEMLCSCQCEQKGYVENAKECMGAGTYKCGICECNRNHFGKHCECSSEHMYNFMNTLSCKRDPEDTSVCSGRGICICGKCSCQRDTIYGKFCECDNFSCPLSHGKICGGRGTCDCGVCNCKSPWNGDACEKSVLKS
ncbi:PREDICTED: integrin beta-PS-like [Nicrophorus vespilloides]|uniref:Integrin beta n=1 Tax=Nicrophorus vespilloides TaxID=110193 RepID=A0ABM1N1V4_NICVS|nr:PREDICTED: integrin beta-PS-like [Nicrophorus vespilloides]XP_017780804.1 PREDICTED: integrin beta-PS-like [Nicrophorus vespilloides]